MTAYADLFVLPDHAAYVETHPAAENAGHGHGVVDRCLGQNDVTLEEDNRVRQVDGKEAGGFCQLLRE